MVRCFSFRIYQVERRWIEVDLEHDGWCCFAVVLVLRVPSLPFFRCYSWMSFSCSLPFILYYNNVLSLSG
uniref:Uncharacterized protein n=1 Tax=Anopheles christyi TaxID=43041 RepID=A0A182KI59_9DIPT